DGDGVPDVVTANSRTGTVSVLRGLGGGMFAAKADYATGAGPDAVAVGDLNADGKLDVVAANRFARSVSVLLGNGDGTPGALARPHVAGVPGPPAATAFTLLAPRPNPSSGAIELRLVLATPARVRAEILDLGGRRVRTLRADRVASRGGVVIPWDGRDARGQS